MDPKRLPNQLLEGQIIMQALVTGNGWQHHPAVKMWVGYEAFYLKYLSAFNREWVRRGHKMHGSYLNAVGVSLDLNWDMEDVEKTPPWWGSDRLHASHRAMLLRKDPAWYGPKFADERERLETITDYYWPVR